MDRAGTVSAVVGTTMAVGGLLGSNKKVRNWGVGLLALGLIFKNLADRD